MKFSDKNLKSAHALPNDGVIFPIERCRACHGFEQNGCPILEESVCGQARASKSLLEEYCNFCAVHLHRHIRRYPLHCEGHPYSVGSGVLFAFLLSPVVNRLQRLGCNNVAAVGLASGAVFGIIAMALVLIVSSLSQLSSDVPRYQLELSKKVAGVRDYGRQFSGKLTQIATDFSDNFNTPEEGNGNGEKAINNKSSADKETRIGDTTSGSNEERSRGSSPKQPIYVEAASDSMLTIRSWAGSAGAILGPLGTVGLVLVFALFLLVYRDDLRDRFVATISRGNYVVSTEALLEASVRISRYLFAQLILNVSYGLLFAGGLLGIGSFLAPDGQFPNALLLGFLAGLVRFVPYAGPLVGAAFPILIAIAIFPGYQVVAAVILMIVVMELLSNNVVEPLVYGSSTGVSSLAVILAAVFWGTLWGPVGLLLATPLTVCLVVLGTYVPRFRFMATLLSDSQQIEPSLRIFQRLIAGDMHKLRELIKTEKTDRSVEEFFDQIVVPTCRRLVRNGEQSSINELELTENFSKAIEEAGVFEEKIEPSTTESATDSESTTVVADHSTKPACYAIATNREPIDFSYTEQAT